MSESAEHLCTISPSFRDARQGRHLLVWGELGQWMVVDNDLLDFIGRFMTPRTVATVLKDMSKVRVLSPDVLWQNHVEPLVRELRSRNILNLRGWRPSVPDDQVAISNLTLTITNRCNLKCPWCYNYAGKHQTDEAPIDAIFDAIAADTSILADKPALMVLGGEPTLRMRRLRRTLDRAADLFEERVVTTNGTRLSHGVVRQLAKREATVLVSLDAPAAGFHDRLRGRGVFRQAMRGVDRLVKQGVPTILSMTLSRSSVPQLEPFFQLAMDRGVGQVRLVPMRTLGRGVSHPEQVPDLFDALQILTELLRENPQFCRLLGRDYFSVLAQLCWSTQRRASCGVGRRVVFVDADAAVYPCPNFVEGQWHCGTLLGASLADIVRRSVALTECRKIHDVHNYPTCSQCAFRYWCSGDCRAEAAAVGAPHAPNPHCQEIQKVLVELMWLLTEPKSLFELHRRPIAAAPIAF